MTFPSPDASVSRPAAAGQCLAALGAVLALQFAASAALAQQQQPPAWAQGRPPGMENSQLAPHAPRMTVTAPDKIPLDKINVPSGFKVELWAHGMPGARMMTLGDKGTVFVGTRTIGRVYAVFDSGGERKTQIIAQGLTQPNGVVFRNGALYVAAISRMLRYDGVEEKLSGGLQPVDLTTAFQLPPEPHHGWKFLAFGPDNKLYVPIGAPCNICEVSPAHAQIRRYNADGSGMEVVARGVRNSVGFDFHPRTGELWFTDNGRDWAGEDGPEEELNRVTTPGADYGFPYCHAQGLPDPDIKKENACDGVVKPVALLGPHAAALGMRFYTGQMFPAEYRERIFVARRGSWNRTEKFGYDVVMVSANPDGTNAKVEPFMTGFLDKQSNSFWGRPADVMQIRDGSLLVSDEENGAIYRVSYQR
ncbi:MAG TPA: PQQ-dependent sugar dehydrogenase [Alphaproteobacteria bacterium]|nr:PQQ-dependent sugar dehydrogenase [Alphaproteobacteria bacterium]